MPRLSRPARARGREALSGLLLLGVTVMVAQLLVTGRVHLMVGPIVITLLWVALPILAGLTLWTLAAAVGRPSGHGLPRVAALVALPVAVVLALDLQPLGLVGTLPRAKAGRSASAKPSPSSTVSQLQLPQDSASPSADPSDDDEVPSREQPIGIPPKSYPALTGDPAEVNVYDYILRAGQPKGRPTLQGRKLAIIGFASTDPENPSGPWVLVRLRLWCCVADALPYMITMTGPAAAERPAGGQWVRVVGTYLPLDAKGYASLKVESVEHIKAPSNPYLT